MAKSPGTRGRRRRPRSNFSTQRHLMTESLEARELLTASPAISPFAMLDALSSSKPSASDSALAPSGTVTGISSHLLSLASPGVPELPAISIPSDENPVVIAEAHSGNTDPDLVAFAQSLTTAGIQVFGAAWDETTTMQRELFGDGAFYLDFVESTNADRTPNQQATEENITVYPTWINGNGDRLVGSQTLESLSTWSGIAIPESDEPALKTIGTKELLSGSPLLVALDGYDPNGGQLTYSVTVDDASLVTAEILSGNRSLELDVAGFGSMIFQAFEDRAPRATDRILGLALDGFYDGVTFHRILNDFVIQGGDPTGTGSGGSDLGTFDDQFDVDLQHNQTGILSMAKSDDDTNDSQFFVTEGAARHLDFNHTIFGYLVEGEAVREAISNTETTGTSGRPTNDVVIQTATVFTDIENGVLMLKSPEGTSGTTSVTVTVTDADGHTSTETFTVNITPDTDNGAPFLVDMPGEYVTEVDTSIDIPLGSIDVEGDDDESVYDAVSFSDPPGEIDIDQETEILTFTPPPGQAGTHRVIVGVSDDGFSAFDSQVFEVVITGIDLLPDSDGGLADDDNLTNTDTWEIAIQGIPEGVTARLLRGTDVIGTETADADGATFTYDASGDTGTVTFHGEYDLDDTTISIDHTLTVTIDRDGPSGEITSTPPESVQVLHDLGYDVEHADEGGDLSYSLSQRPTLATIDSETGLISWTPPITFTGTATFSVVASDTAGNQVTQMFEVDVLPPDPRVEFTMEVLDNDGNPTTTLDIGDTFTVNVFVQDVRNYVDDADKGLFLAYVDLLYESDFVEFVPGSNNTQIGDLFSFTPRFDLSQPGLIDEAGGINASLTRFSDRQLVLSQVFQAVDFGTAQLNTQTAVALDENNRPTSTHDLSFIGSTDEVREREIIHASLDIMIYDGFQAADDSITADEDAVATLDVLRNDSLPDFLEISDWSIPDQGGALEISSDGRSFLYTPASNYFGTETFQYTIRDTNDVTSTATVTITVDPVNDDPEGVADHYDVGSTSIEFLLPVLSNDSSAPDIDEELRIASVSTGSAGGTIVVSDDRLNIIYTPASLDFVGDEFFTYFVSDGNGGSTEVEVSINVLLGAPATPDLAPASDSGTDNDDITNANSFEMSVGSVAIGAVVSLRQGESEIASETATSDTITFTFDAPATDGSFEYTAIQRLGDDISIASGPLTIEVDRTGPGAFTSTAPTSARLRGVVDYDADVAQEGAETVIYSLHDAPTGFTIDANGRVEGRITNDLATIGDDLQFTIRAADLADNRVEQVVTLAITAAEPKVSFQLRATDLSGAAADPDSNNPIDGTLTVGEEFRVYVMVENISTELADQYVAAAIVDMTYNHTQLSVVPGTGNYRIGEEFDSGQISGDNSVPGIIDESGGENLDGVAGSNVLFVQQFRVDAGGILTWATDPAEGVDKDGNSTEHLRVALSDYGLVDVADIEFGSLELFAMEAVDDTLNATEDTTTTLAVLSNDHVDETTTIVAVTDPTSGGTALIASDGKSLEYTPADDFFGSETLTYTIQRGTAAATATVTISVANTNDDPTGLDDIFDIGNNSNALFLDVLQNDTSAPDPTENLFVSAVSDTTNGGTVTVAPNGTGVLYTAPSTSFIGDDSFTYTVDDGNGGTAEVSVSVRVTIATTAAPVLLAESDSGRSDSDRITNADSLQVRVADVLGGATVILFADGSSVGELTAGATDTELTFTVDATALAGTVVITAQQSLGGQTSAESAELVVEIDREVPNRFLSTSPDIAFVGADLAYDVLHEEEGDNGVRFRLSGAADNVSIDSVTGLIAWTPTTEQLGEVNFIVFADDAAGNTASHVVHLEVVGTQVEWTTRITDHHGNNASAFGEGSTFILEVFVQDLRTSIDASLRGVFGAFADIEFDPTQVTPTGPAEISTTFDGSLTATGAVEGGRIEGIGGVNLSERSAEPQLVFKQSFRATGIGTSTLTVHFAEDRELDGTVTDIFDIVLFDQSEPVPEVATHYGSSSVEVVAGLQLTADEIDVVRDGGATTLDVLANDTAGPTSDDLVIVSASPPDGGGNVSIASDGKSLIYEPANGFLGTELVSYTVEDGTGASRTSLVTIHVIPPTPASLVLQADSDSGTSSTDGITNAQQLDLRLTGLDIGAEVSLFADGTEVATVTADATEIIATVDATALDGTVAFTAQQTVNGISSAATDPTLITLDRTAPDLVSSQPPSTGTAGIAWQYDVQHSEEADGTIIYHVENGPLGLTIDTATGVIGWTPSADQVGDHSFDVVVTDLAGNERIHPVSVEITGVQAGLTIQVVDHTGNLTSTVGRGSAFAIEVYAQDVRDDIDEALRGISSMFVDLLFNGDVTTPTGVAEIGTDFQGTQEQTGSAETDAIRGIGGVNAGTRSATPTLLFRQAFRADGVGSATFGTSFSTVDDILVFDQSTPLTELNISFGTATLQITEGLTANDDTFTAVENSRDVVIDVLNNDLTGPTSGAITISATGETSQGGTVAIASNGESILYTPARQFFGPETFSYTIEDEAGATRVATVTVDVTELPGTTVTGTVFWDVNANGTHDTDERGFANVTVTLEGTDEDGEAVSLQTVTTSNGGYSFERVPSGNYVVTQDHGGLMISSGVLSGGIVETPLTVDAALSGDVTTVPASSPVYLRPEFAMLYALASTPESSVELATSVSGTAQWQLLDTAWASYNILAVELAGDTLTLRVSNQSGEEQTASVSASSSHLVQILGQADGTRLVRISGSPSDLGITDGPSANAVDLAIANL